MPDDHKTPKSVIVAGIIVAVVIIIFLIRLVFFFEWDNMTGNFVYDMGHMDTPMQELEDRINDGFDEGVQKPGT